MTQPHQLYISHLSPLSVSYYIKYVEKSKVEVTKRWRALLDWEHVNAISII